MRQQPPPRKSLISRFLKVLSIAIAGAAVALAGAWVFAPVPEAGSDLPFTTVTATEGTVQSQLRLDVSANWVDVPAAENQAQGVVTGTDQDPDRPKQVGDVLYSVGLRPVVVAQGAIPSFRDLAEGDEGADVALLQEFLASVSLFAGEQDGIFNANTTAAVKDWQKSLKIPADGQVRSGDIVYVDVLPAVITTDSTLIARGLTISGGELALRIRSAYPEFSIALSKKQRDIVQSDQLVEIGNDGESWKAVVSEIKPDPEQGSEGAIAALKPANGKSICADRCETINAEGPSSFRGTVQLQDPISGVLLPSAALVTNGAGQTQVIRDTGVVVDVEVLGSANGQAVISGIDVGSIVRVPGQPVNTKEK